MKILYSPIGNSDPICYDHDGPWLHCVRHILPDKCVLFLTGDMCKKEDDRGIYSHTLDKMSQYLMAAGKISAPMELGFIRYPELAEAHESDVVHPLLREDIRRIHEEYPDAEIYLNVRSGTTAIKTALEVLFHTLPYKMVLCMTKNTKKDADKALKGSRETVGDDYDWELAWEFNKDNEEGAPCRLTTQKWGGQSQLGIELQIQQIKTLVRNYEYSAAQMMLPEGYASDQLKKALEGAIYRQRWNFHMAGIKLNEAGWGYGKVISRCEKESLYQAAEAVLTMDQARKREDYGSMIRQLTPVLLPLTRAALKKEDGVDTDLFIISKNEKLRLNRTKLKEKYPEKYSILEAKGTFDKRDDPFVDSQQMLDIMAPTPMKTRLEHLRDMETDARNKAAHSLQPVSIPDPDGLIKEIFGIIGGIDSEIIPANFRKSYDELSDYIISLF